MIKEIKKTEFNLCMENVQSLELGRIYLYNKIYLMILRSLLEQLTFKKSEHPKSFENIALTLGCLKLIPENPFSENFNDYSTILNDVQIVLLKQYPHPERCIEVQEVLTQIDLLCGFSFDFYTVIDIIMEIQVTLNAIIRRLIRIEEEILSIESCKLLIEVLETTLTDPLLADLKDILQC